MTTFFRILGMQAGIQLNMISDESGTLPIDQSDQRAAISGIFDRGRVDKAFIVNGSNIRRRLGAPTPLRGANPIEAYRHVDHAIWKGAQEVFVARVMNDYTNKWVVLTLDDALGTAGQILSEYGDPITDEMGAYLLPEIVADPAAAPEFSVRAYLSTDNGLSDPKSIIAFKLKDLITGGFTLRTSVDDGAERTPSIDRVFINIAIVDKDNQTVLYAIRGTISQTAQDEQGKSLYIGDYADNYNDVFQFARGQYADADLLDVLNSDAASVLGQAVDKAWPLTPFVQGTTALQPINYVNAVSLLTARQTEFFYLMGGGTQNSSLLREIYNFGRRWNKSVQIDIPSYMTPEEGATWLADLGLDPKSYWVSVTHNLSSFIDRLTTMRVRIGLSGYKVGLACARNAIRNTNGFAKKQHPIAGYDYPISLAGQRMEVELDPAQNGDGYLLDLMARYHINPVLFDDFGQDEARWVFYDSLTQYLPNEKDMKLESVAERAMNLDSTVVGIVKRLQQSDSETVISDANDRISAYFDDVFGAGWIKVSDKIGGKSYLLSVKQTNNSDDSIDVNYTIHYVGTNRQTFVQQTVV